MDANTAPASPHITGMIQIGGNRVLFTADEVEHGNELWVTDGTEAGTSLVRDLNPGSAGSSPRDFSVVDGVAFFRASNGTQTVVWQSDGTAEGTVQLPVVERLSEYVVLVQQVYLVGEGGLHVFDLATRESSVVDPDAIGVSVSSLGIIVRRANLADPNEVDLWFLDGATERLLREGEEELDLIRTTYESDGVVFFDTHELEVSGGLDQTVWRSDGTASGTCLLYTSDAADE